ncbi:MAG: gliding motility-associated C-terminal domain-containing protein [Bacteroidota bacterium]
MDGTKEKAELAGHYILTPFTAEICANGIDDDGDGMIDCEDGDCVGSYVCSTDNTCQSLGENLVLNGDFEQGYFGFSSDFGRGRNNPQGGACPTTGWFAVGKSTNLTNLQYYGGSGSPGSYTNSDPLDISNTSVATGSQNDHTTGKGNFLVANPNEVEGAALWYQDIVVCAGQRYFFSAWMKNISAAGQIPPSISFGVNGQRLMPYTEMTSQEWQEVHAAFISSVSGVVRISILNGEGCEGNDIAIDDISFRLCSDQIIEITGEESICVGEELFLSIHSVDSSRLTPEYQWQRSEDRGKRWLDIPGEYFPFLVYEFPSAEMMFRVVVAEKGSIDQRACRLVSNVIQPEILNCVAEICNNGIDDDKDGYIDEDDVDCADSEEFSCGNPGLKYFLPSVWRNNRRGFPHSLFLSTAFPEAKVNLTNADGTFTQDILVSSEAPYELNLPNDIVVTKQINTIERNKGLIITSDVPISPLYRISNRFNRMLANLKGNGALGRNFRLASPVRARGNAVNEERHFFSIMATKDSTTIKVDESPFPLDGVTLPFTTVLNAGETILFHPENHNHHITGTLVAANEPVSVFVGTQHTDANRTRNREAGGDLAIPFTKLGKHYVCIRGGFPSSRHDYAMVVAIMDGTQVFMDGDPFPRATLNAGEYKVLNIEGEKGDPHYIRTSKEVYVYQVSGNLALSRQQGEFGMAVLPPISSQQCTGVKSAAVPKFLEPGTLNDLYIIAPDNALNSLKIDGQPFTNFGIANNVPGYPGFSAVYFDQNTIPNKVNVVSSDEYMHVGQLVGLNGTGAYGYYSDYSARVDVLDPEQALPTAYYLVDTICLGTTVMHDLWVESCGNEHKIVSGSQGTGTISFAANDTRVAYTAKEEGLDIIHLTVANEHGFSGNICLGFYVTTTEAYAGVDQVVCPGENIQFQGSGGQSYDWSPAEGLSTSTAANPFLQPVHTTDFQLTVTDGRGCTDVDSVRVTVNPAPLILSQKARLCEDDSREIALSVYEELMNVRRIEGTFSYYDENWNPLANPDAFQAFDGAMVNVVFLDIATLCADSAILNFVVQPSIEIPSKIIEVCRENADSIDLTLYEAAISLPQGVFTYIDETGNEIQNPESISVLDGENIMVTYASNLCQASAVYTFHYKTPPPVFAGNDTTICPGTQLPLYGRGEGTLRWEAHSSLSDTSVINPLASPAIPTSYILTTYDQFGCVNEGAIEVGIFSVAAARMITGPSICQGDSVQLMADGGVSYLWDNHLTLSDTVLADPFAYPGKTTLYTVEITDLNGCVRTDTLTVEVRPVPRADAGEDLALCLGEMVRLRGGGEGDRFSWSPSIGLSDPDVNNPFFSGNLTTTYTLTVTNEEGCVDTDQMEVVVNTLPEVQIYVSETEVCSDEPVILEASGADVYRWTPGFDFPDPSAQTVNINPSVPALYVLEGYTYAGCYGTDSVYVITHNGPNAVISPDSSICEGDTISLGAFGGTTHVWSTIEPMDTIQVSPQNSTDYWVIPYSDKGCAGDTAFMTITTTPYPQAMFSPNTDSAFIQDEILFLNQSESAAGYYWNFGDGNSSEEEDPSHAYGEVGLFTVELIAYNELGCTDTMSFSYMDIIRSQLFGPNAFTPNGDGHNDVFKFKFLGIEQMTLKIFNQFGSLIFENTGKEPTWDGKVNGASAPEGVYVFSLDVLEARGYQYTRSGSITLFR